MEYLTRWRGALAGSLLASALGLYLGASGFFVLALVPLAYVVYGSLTGLGPPSLVAERRLAEDHTDPGESTAVELTVTNVGERPIPDLRLRDGVPGDVRVVDGTPATAVALRPGESTTISYDVLPPRGTHEFGAVTARGRSVAGTVVGTTRIDPEGATTLTCETLLDQFPLGAETTRLAGQRPTATGGDGSAFHSVREYRRGDPLGRVDWRRLAKTGDLGTVTYREERAATVVFVVDDRVAATAQPPDGGPDTTDYAVYAASAGLRQLTAAGHRVGVTTLASPPAWVEPGRDDATRAAATALFERLTGTREADDTVAQSVATDGAGGGSDDPTGFGLELIGRLPGDAQVVLCSPLLDDVPVTVAVTAAAHGHSVTVLSPSVAGVADGQPTPGVAAADLARRTRLVDLRRRGVTVTDWSLDTPLQLALASTMQNNSGWKS